MALLSIHAAVYNVFNIQRHLNSRRTLRVLRDQAMLTWRHATVAAWTVAAMVIWPANFRL